MTADPFELAVGAWAWALEHSDLDPELAPELLEACVTSAEELASLPPMTPEEETLAAWMTGEWDGVGEYNAGGDQ